MHDVCLLPVGQFYLAVFFFILMSLHYFEKTGLIAIHCHHTITKSFHCVGTIKSVLSKFLSAV